LDAVADEIEAGVGGFESDVDVAADLVRRFPDLLPYCVGSLLKLPPHLLGVRLQQLP